MEGVKEGQKSHIHALGAEGLHPVVPKLRWAIKGVEWSLSGHLPYLPYFFCYYGYTAYPVTEMG